MSVTRFTAMKQDLRRDCTACSVRSSHRIALTDLRSPRDEPPRGDGGPGNAVSNSVPANTCHSSHSDAWRGSAFESLLGPRAARRARAGGVAMARLFPVGVVRAARRSGRRAREIDLVSELRCHRSVSKKLNKYVNIYTYHILVQ